MLRFLVLLEQEAKEAGGPSRQRPKRLFGRVAYLRPSEVMGRFTLQTRLGPLRMGPVLQPLLDLESGPTLTTMTRIQSGIGPLLSMAELCKPLIYREVGIETFLSIVFLPMAPPHLIGDPTYALKLADLHPWT